MVPTKRKQPLDDSFKDELCREFLTIADFVRFAVTEFTKSELFYGHGTANAFDEAVYLILRTLHISDEDFYPEMLTAHLLPAERRALCDILLRRINERVPAAYLTNHMAFAGLDFYVDERVLVPRSPIAELIADQFQPWCDPEQVTDILDLCTGSGCIAIATAHMFPDAEVDASDISPGALQVAKINVEKYRLQKQVNLFQSDLFSDLPHKQYDIIVSNPPYVSEEELFSVPDEYQHEPKLGLQAGEDGLDVVRTILFTAKRYLKPDGFLITEVGNSKDALVEQFPNLAFTWLEFESGGDGVFLINARDLPEKN